MKNSDKELEKKMLQILENQEIDFQESDWEAAQLLIQNANFPAPKKQRRFILWAFTFLFGIGIFMPFFVGKEALNTQILGTKKDFLRGFKKQKELFNSDIKNSESESYILKEENKTTQKPSNAANLPVQILTQNNPSILPSKMAEQQRKPYDEGENELEAKKLPAFSLAISSVSQNQNILPLAPKIMDNQAINPNLVDSSNTNISPSQKVCEIEKPNIRLSPPPAFPKNIAPLPDFPLKNRRFSAQIFAGTAVSFAKNATSKPTFYGGFQTNYQLHKNIKLLLFSELSARRVRFLNSNPNMATPDMNSMYDYETNCQPDIALTNVVILNKITLQRNLLYYASIGLGISLPYKRHELALSAAFQKIIETSSNYELRMLQSGNLIYEEKKKVNGFMEGLNNQDISLFVSYQYAINRHFQFQVAGNFGCKDMSNNVFYGNSFKDRNVQLRAGLAYKIW